jgi:Rrf2 family protein
MRIELGRKGDYAVRAALHLARHNEDGRRKTREIAADMDIPEKYLPQVLGELVRAGLVASVAGPDGGYELVRTPEEVSLLEVVEAAEGPVRSETCVLRGGPCRWDDACAIHFAWSEAQNAFVDRLARTTFALLAETDVGLESGTIAVAERHRPINDVTRSRSAEGGRNA